ncbi:MAG: hypothetical protein FWE27_03125 [Defluviitaleaceae bacterium]|nr:hypothetical protein [Defluviitaleaceae bacterium]
MKNAIICMMLLLMLAACGGRVPEETETEFTQSQETSPQETQIQETQDEDTIMTFNGNSIPVSDFIYFHAMLGAPFQDEEVNEMAITGMLRALVVLERAERHGLRVSAEGMARYEEEAAQVREWFTARDIDINDLSNRRIAEFISVGTLFDKVWIQPGPLYDALMEVYFSDYEPAQNEIDKHLEEWMDEIVEAATDEGEVNIDLIDEYKQIVIENFIYGRREDALFDLVEEWVAESDYQLNEHVLSRF